jgi:hypothetical protein
MCWCQGFRLSGRPDLRSGVGQGSVGSRSEVESWDHEVVEDIISQQAKRQRQIGEQYHPCVRTSMK